jgi:SepF-like predicted cell division protein (DUF552 family)
MPRRSNHGVAIHVIKTLEQDHKRLKDLFQEYKTATSKQKAKIAHISIQELELHAHLEERLIYPAIREEIDAKDVVNEAIEEHHLVHVLIADLKNLKPNAEQFKAKFNVLAEVVKRHIKEEEDEMLPRVGRSHIDWETLSARVTQSKEQFLAKQAPRPRGRRGIAAR